MARVHTKRDAASIPESWQRALNYRPPDFRALIATMSDPVVRRKGLAIYEEMLLDPQVYGSLNLLKFAALALDWTVAPRGDGDDEAARIAKEVEAMLEGWPGGLTEMLYSALSALEYGWSITELTWQSEDGKWYPNEWVTLPQSIYGFEIDEKTGKPVGVRRWYSWGAKNVPTWPLENFVIMQWNARFGAPYGRSQLLAAYEPWWVKQLLRRMRNTTLDRYGAPLLAAKVPSSWDEEKRRELEEFLQNLYAESGLIVDSTVEVQPIHQGSGQGAAQGFQAAIEYEDAQIAKAITGAVLNANESRGTGTYAQAKVHQDNFLYWVRRVARLIERTVQGQIIDRFCRYNYGLSPKETPVFTISDPETENTTALAGMIVQLAGIGLIDPQKDGDWIRERLGFPPEEKPARGGFDFSSWLSGLAGAPSGEPAPQEKSPETPEKGEEAPTPGGEEEGDEQQVQG